jgi:hypothetical protein
MHTHTYTHVQVMMAVRTAINDEATFEAFRSDSAAFRRGESDCAEYYATVCDTHLHVIGHMSCRIRCDGSGVCHVLDTMSVTREGVQIVRTAAMLTKAHGSLHLG